MQDIFEQVDEQFDADRVQKFWDKNRRWVVAGLVLFFLALFAYVGWRDYQVEKSQSAAEQFTLAWELFDQKERVDSQKQLRTLVEKYSGHGYALFGRFLLAKSLAGEGKTEAAVAQLELLAKEADLPTLVDLALLSAANLTSGDVGRSEAFLARIDKYSPYQGHALELQGLLATQRGDDKSALNHYRKARTLTPEGTLRTRLESRIERLAGGENK